MSCKYAARSVCLVIYRIQFEIILQCLCVSCILPEDTKLEEMTWDNFGNGRCTLNELPAISNVIHILLRSSVGVRSMLVHHKKTLGVHKGSGRDTSVFFSPVCIAAYPQATSWISSSELRGVTIMVLVLLDLYHPPFRLLNLCSTASGLSQPAHLCQTSLISTQLSALDALKRTLKYSCLVK